MDSRAYKLGEVILRYSLNIKKGERLLIMGSEAVIPFMKLVFKLAVKYGANPQIQLDLDGLLEWVYKFGDINQIKYIPPSEIEAIKTVDAILYVAGDSNTRRFTGVEEFKTKEKRCSREVLINIFNERIEKGEIRICNTLFPTQGNAQEADMALMDYEDYIYNACKIGEGDAFEDWFTLKGEQERIRKLLNRGNSLRIISRDTDISMSVKERKWISCLGHENFPGGEIFTSPIENSAEGVIKFNCPLIFEGRKIDNISLSFEKGKVVKCRASRGGRVLNELLKIDEGAKFLGEVGIGMNYSINKFTHNILLDEKVGGTVHLALGAGFKEARGVNKSNIHIDMLLSMAKDGSMLLDDNLIYKNGKFII